MYIHSVLGGFGKVEVKFTFVEHCSIYRNSVNICTNLLFVRGQVYRNKITVNINVLIIIRNLFS